MFVAFIFGFLSLLLIWDHLCRRRHKQIAKENDFDGPQSLPLIGAAHHLMGQNSETVMQFLSQKINGSKLKTIQFSILHDHHLCTANAKFIEAVLSSQQVIQKGAYYDLLKYWLGLGLLLSTGKKWHTRRKIITPTFHFKILEQFVEVFDRQSAVMVNKLYERADGKSAVNIFPVVCLTALDIIAETAMGVKVNAQMDPDFPYIKSVRTVAEITATRLISPSQRTDFSMRIFAPREYKKLCKNIKAMHDFTDKVIAERKATLEKSIAAGTYDAEEVNDVGLKKRMTFLDVLLQANVAGSPLSNTDIREEVDTFMFEGHDTTTSGISYTLYLIARHPEVQQKLFDEILQVIGDDKNKPITMRDLQELKYLECVIKEGLRLYPPVPIISRYVTQDTVLDGKLVPANTNIDIIMYHTLRDPEYFPDPDAFKPERFYAESTERIDPFAYVPFSAGPRNCVGQKFALLEMKSTISKVIRHFELLPFGDEVRPVMNIILRSVNGIHLGLKPRIY